MSRIWILFTQGSVSLKLVLERTIPEIQNMKRRNAFKIKYYKGHQFKVIFFLKKIKISILKTYGNDKRSFCTVRLRQGWKKTKKWLVGRALRIDQTWEVDAWDIAHLGSYHVGKSFGIFFTPPLLPEWGSVANTLNLPFWHNRLSSAEIAQSETQRERVRLDITAVVII